MCCNWMQLQYVLYLYEGIMIDPQRIWCIATVVVCRGSTSQA